ncbi:Cell division control protein 25 [Psilocybe cubensis]|uniref:Uncharacterized protein n=2 Tax=Psilocybe cubensis TaxID=181762 RepID=A0A8H8CJ17_PSICU|nr:Cell division control protein 25 [Psilocybe cubensis]KAH9476031.1 Cell division control protein 25 [Psilocybe cubensis]
MSNSHYTDHENAQDIDVLPDGVDLEDIRQSLKNLEHAVITNRLPIIRLCTRRVSYCVRTLLRTTDVLQHNTNTVRVRQRLLKLAKQRESVLDTLNTLITQSQDVLMEDIVEDERENGTVQLLGTSEQLASLVQELVFTADECGYNFENSNGQKIITVEYDIMTQDILKSGHALAYLKPSSEYFLQRKDIEYSDDGTLLYATMDALVEEMTPHDSLVDQAFSATFFMTFRLFSSAAELLEIAITRWNLVPPSNFSQERLHMWQHRKWIPVRLRVLNLIKTWIQYHWESSDDSVLHLLEGFLKETADFLDKSKAISLDLLQVVSQRLLSPGTVTVKRARGLSESKIDPNVNFTPPTPRRYSVNQAPSFPASIISKPLLASLQKKEFDDISITMFEPLELARQLTIMESNLFCALRPSEILGADQAGKNSARGVETIMTISTAISKWVTENVAKEAEHKKTRRVFKFFIQLANCCLELNNFSTCRSIMAALKPNDSIWSALTQKQREQAENLNFLADPERYQNRLNETTPPAIPILSRHMYDIIFCQRDAPSYISSIHPSPSRLINFGKYREIAKLVQNLLAFQVPYSLKPIPEVQEYLTFCFATITLNATPDQFLQYPIHSHEHALVSATIAHDSIIVETSDSKSDRVEESSISINTATRDISLYSLPSSRTGSTDYGLFYTRHACSQDSFGSQWWAEAAENNSPPINV